MPNTGHTWTEQEEQDAVDLDWAEFTLRYPGISRDAYRLRRQGLIRAGRTPAPSNTSCKVCRFLRRLHRHDREAWEDDLSKPVRGKDALSHRAAELALRASGVAVEESSVRRHRRNHIGDK